MDMDDKQIARAIPRRRGRRGRLHRVARAAALGDEGVR